MNRGKREVLADYSLPAAVVIGAFFGSFVFKDVYCKSQLFIKVTCQNLMQDAWYCLTSFGVMCHVLSVSAISISNN